MKLKTPCIDCGAIADNTRCSACSTKHETARQRGRVQVKKSSTERGYGSTWRRLSERARQLQTFCSDCGATNDLQADHTPEAWKRYEKGLPIRLSDIDIVCGPCNRTRGAARGKHARSDSKRPDRSDDTEGA